MATRKTARGQMIDMETIVTKGEKTVAVGNMGVNAKGDRLGPGGEIIKDAREETAAYYEGDEHAIKTTQQQGIHTPITTRDQQRAAEVAEAAHQAEQRAQYEADQRALKEAAAIEPVPMPDSVTEEDWDEDKDGNFVKKPIKKTTKKSTKK